MVNAKKKRFPSKYLSNVPFPAGAGSNFLAGAVCRLMQAAFPVQNMSALNILLCVLAMVFTTAVINFSAYVTCSAFARRTDRHLPLAAALVSYAAAFVIGLMTAPYLLLLASR